MEQHIDKNTPTIKIGHRTIACVKPILAEANGWIDQENADRAWAMQRLVMVAVYRDHKFDCVVGYIDRDLMEEEE